MFKFMGLNELTWGRGEMCKEEPFLSFCGSENSAPKSCVPGLYSQSAKQSALGSKSNFWLGRHWRALGRDPLQCWNHGSPGNPGQLDLPTLSWPVIFWPFSPLATAVETGLIIVNDSVDSCPRRKIVCILFNFYSMSMKYYVHSGGVFTFFEKK